MKDNFSLYTLFLYLFSSHKRSIKYIKKETEHHSLDSRMNLEVIFEQWLKLMLFNWIASN